MNKKELSIIQKTYDLIKWYVPILNRLPKDHKFGLAERLINNLYELLEGLIRCKYASEKLDKLQELNILLDIIRYQSRILQDFQLINLKRYENISEKLNDIGLELGSWIKSQKSKQK